MSSMSTFCLCCYFLYHQHLEEPVPEWAPNTDSDKFYCFVFILVVLGAQKQYRLDFYITSLYPIIWLI